MATKPETRVQTVGSQRDRRYLDTFYDTYRHARFPEGRPWHGYREFAANQGQKDGFCTELSPGRHVARDEEGNQIENPEVAWATVWNAPWYPEQRFFQFNYLRNTLTIRYDQIAGLDRQFLDKYYEAAAVISHEKGWDETEYGASPRHGVTAIIGRPPRSPKIAEAAQAGDPWLMGASAEVNVELAQLLGLSRHGIALRVEREPLVTAEQVLSTKPDELSRMIADAVAKAMEVRDQEEAKKKEAQRASMARARSQRKPTNSLPKAG